MAQTKIDDQQETYQLIARAITNYNKLGPASKTRAAAQSRLDHLERNWGKFELVHQEIKGLVSKAEERIKLDYFKNNLFELCEETYLQNKSEFINILDSFDSVSNASDTNSSSGRNDSRSARTAHLPKISLPRFNGQYQEWVPFRDMFQSIVGDNDQLSEVEKLHYLKSSVGGDAAKIIANIAITEENYERAWSRLTARYQNKRALVNAQLDALFAIKPVLKKSAYELELLRSTVAEVVDSLSALGGQVEAWDFFLVYFICQRLDPESHEAWEIHLSGKQDPPTYSELNVFIEGRVRALESVDAKHPGSSFRSGFRSSTSRQTPTSRAHVASTRTPSCACCGSAHYISSCEAYRNMNVGQRRELVNSKRLCFNCLGPHVLRRCTSAKRCLECNQQHHTSLHPIQAQPTQVHSNPEQQSSRSSVSSTATPATGGHRPTSSGQNSTPAGASNAPAPRNVANQAAVNHAAVLTSRQSGPARSILATALITVISPHGNETQARALLDQGSELLFICEKLVQALHMPRRKSAISLVGIGALKNAVTRGAISLRFQNSRDPSIEFDVEAHILPRVTARIPSSPVEIDGCDHLSGLELADPTFAIPGPIDIILGANIYGHLLKGEIRRSSRQHPVAQLTHLGWVVSGPVSSTDGPSVRQGFTCTVDHELTELVHQFWAQEAVPSPKTAMLSEDDARCEEFFKATTVRKADGRYQVRLPFKERPTTFGDSKSIARKMLTNMQRRFQRDENFKKLYCGFLEEYETLGHMKPAGGEDEESSFFLPHHGVLRNSRVTTKLRVVFNGSQKTNTGLSLNDCLFSGPKCQRDLFDVLLRWRMYAYAFSADIEKMYRQVHIHPDDQKYQKILWSPCQSQEPTQKQLTTVTFGLTCAPFQANRVLRQLSEDEGETFPLGAEVVRDNMYVDDALSGEHSVESAREKAHQVDQLLMAGGFVLQKWTSNHPDVLAAVDKERQYNLPKTFDDGPILRALGVSWNPVSDEFVLSSQQDGIVQAIPTKRAILSLISRLFDPLGWLAPIVIKAKIFLQKLWRTELKWDEKLPPELAEEWSGFAGQLETDTSFSIPRWCGTSPSASVEIHGFSDASQDALAAVIYSRITSASQQVTTSLLVSKTRVAPLKKITIARLELSAAHLMSQLVNRIQVSLALETAQVHLWVDSSVALTWIRGHPSKWKEYVANRVSAIQDLTPRAAWHHVAGVQNPADAASRGLYPGELADHPLWWRGPPWLTQPPSSWPNDHLQLPENVNLEEKPAVCHVTTTAPPLWIGKYSTLNRLLRVTARLFKAIAIFRRQVRSSPALIPEELDKAMLFWVKYVQSVHFSEELKILKRGESLPRSNHLLRLTPFLDGEGYLRVGGRLDRAPVYYNFKHPLILPAKSELSELVIDAAHKKTLHGGIQLTLSTIRQKYWIIGGRTPVRSYILRCVPCARQRGELAKQLMGQLPPSRTTPSRPFLNSGVDYAGPFTVKSWKGRGAKSYKAYLVLFVCLVTSAVHLELSSDYTTEGFIAAYRRFVGRRGVCATLSSDCGSNLVGADQELKRMFSAASREFAALRDVLASDHTKWIFNPPSAPHFGGKWESAIKSTKHHIRRVVGEAPLTFEEFSCLLVQIEGILNSRPLCPLTEDPSDASALTPGHFLIGGAITAIPEPSLSEVPENRLSRWQKVRRMAEHFWNRWSVECLQRFQAVSKWRRREKQIEIGSLVLVSDERYPPAKWPLARVIAVHPGSDGLTRVVTVRSVSGLEFKRPIVKLCPLPCD